MAKFDRNEKREDEFKETVVALNRVSKTVKGGRIARFAALMVVGISFAFFLGTISQDEGVIELVSNMVFLGMSFISGVFVTRDFMSESVLKVAHFLPVYWYVSGTEQIDTAKVSEIWGSGLVGSLAMQLLFALLFMGAGFVVARKKERYVL